jgi:hypothetical protein
VDDNTWDHESQDIAPKQTLASRGYPSSVREKQDTHVLEKGQPPL